MSIIFIGESEGEKELHLQKHEERTIRVLSIASGYLKEPIYHQKRRRNRKETIRKMGKYLKHSSNNTTTIKMKGEKNMVKIEDLHIGQTVYLWGKTPGKITCINGDDPGVIVRERGTGKRFRWALDNIFFEPKFDLSDLETVKALHYKLWDWLERNPEKTKGDWPRWESNGGDVPDVDAHCFYCHYDKAHKSRGVCEACPSDWKINGNNKFVEDDTESPFCVRGIFGIYQEADQYLLNDNKFNSIAKRIKSKAAHIIKNS